MAKAIVYVENDAYVIEVNHEAIGDAKKKGFQN